MTDVWTCGRWVVMPGNEDAFVEAWTRLAREATVEVAAPAPPTLLRDRDHPNVFLSFGTWNSIDHVAQFRASAAFARGLGAIRPLLESFEALTLDEVWSGG